MAKKKLLIAAIIVGALAACLMALYANQMRKEKRDLIGDTVAVVKAARNIPAGTPLTQDLVTTDLVPVKFLPPNPIMQEDLGIYLDSPLAVNVKDGSMILTSDFSVAEVSRDLSGKVPEEERALSIPVDAISGVSGLLMPGDRVDLLGTFPVSSKEELIPDAGGGGSVGYVTMTLLQNVTLLAVGQQLSGVGAQQDGRRNNYSTVTVAVTVDEAELLTIAQTRGKLMLLLRRRDDIKTAPVTKTTLREVLQDLEVIGKARKERIIKKRKKVIKKPGLVIDSGN